MLEKINYQDALSSWKFFNKNTFKGQITTDLVSTNQNFRMFFVKTRDNDEFRVYTPAQNLENVKISQGDFIMVNGEVHSWDRPIFDRDKQKTIISTFARSIVPITKQNCMEDENHNQVVLVGTIRRDPFISRNRDEEVVTGTLLGIKDTKRDRAYQIPVEFYDEQADIVKNTCAYGDRIAINGKLKTREFPKKLSNGTCVKWISTEVAVKEMQILR